MRVAWIVTLGGLVCWASPRLNSQEIPTTVQRDPQAVAVLQQAISTMAPTPPTDSRATGTVTVVEGSTTQQGTIEILTLGTTQTSETLGLPDAQRSIVYANGVSRDSYGAQSSNPAMQLVLSDQSADFPLPFFSSALANPDESITYIGPETLAGRSVQHIQVWNSFASRPHLRTLTSFSLKDVWIDTTPHLPTKIAYLRRASGGLAPGIPMEVLFSNYNSVSGVQYPLQIQKSRNGTPWQTITIQSVTFNTGLSTAQFQVE